MTRTCILCGGRESVFCFSKGGYDLRACQVCGLFFVTPYPNEVEPAQSRAMKFRYFNSNLMSLKQLHANAVELYRPYLSLIRSECANAKSLLDIGCGTGRLLELMARDTNLYRVGIEPDTQRAEFARRVARCEIHEAFIEQFTHDQKFDVVVLFNVVSHVASFDSLFRSVCALMSDRGKLIIKSGEGTSGVRRKSPRADWGIPEHLHFLGTKTIDFICEKYGFSILRHERKSRSFDRYPSGRRSLSKRPVRRVVENTAFSLPLVLPLLAKIFDLRHDVSRDGYSSFIVLTRK